MPTSLTPRTPLTPGAAYDRLQSLCARSEISSGEARQKLYRMGIGVEQAHEIVERLIAERYIDDRRFAGAFTREKVHLARWSKKKIKHALIAKGVDSEIISEALSEVPVNDELENLRHYLEGIIKNHPDWLTDHKQRTKLFTRAMSRGYKARDIFSVTNSLLSAQSEEEE